MMKLLLASILSLVLIGCRGVPTREPAGAAEGDQTFRSTEFGLRTIFWLRGCHQAGRPRIESRLISLTQNASRDGEQIEQATVDNEGRQIACPKLHILISGAGITFPRLDSIHARAEDNCEYATNAGPVFCTVEIKTGPSR